MVLKKDFHLTKSGVEELRQELKELKKRQLQVADALKAAKEQGDLSENSDWSNAQDEFKFVEGRTNEINHILQNVRIIAEPKDNSLVRLGSQVRLNSNGKKLEYHLVGSLEAKPAAGKISDESPIGKALLGKQVGDSVDIKVPSGTSAFKIVNIT